MNWNDLKQLKFDLELDEVAEDAADRSISAAEARAISEAARIVFEAEVDGSAPLTPTDRGWVAEYLKLRELGWPWRVAAYIAWASSPKIGRWPKSLAELANKVLGLTSPRVIYTWREKYPSLDATVAVMQAIPLMENKRDVIEALIKNASDPDYKTFNDRKLFLEMVGLYTPKSKLDINDQRAKDLSELSDEELDDLMGEGQEIYRKDAKDAKISLSKDKKEDELD